MIKSLFLIYFNTTTLNNRMILFVALLYKKTYIVNIIIFWEILKCSSYLKNGHCICWDN